VPNARKVGGETGTGPSAFLLIAPPSPRIRPNTEEPFRKQQRVGTKAWKADTKGGEKKTRIDEKAREIESFKHIERKRRKKSP